MVRKSLAAAAYVNEKFSHQTLLISSLVRKTMLAFEWEQCGREKIYKRAHEREKERTPNFSTFLLMKGKNRY